MSQHHCEFKRVDGTECGDEAWVGVGAPPVWLCFDHFGIQLQGVREQVQKALAEARGSDD